MRDLDADTTREATLGSRPAHSEDSTLRLPSESLSRLMFGADDEPTVKVSIPDMSADAEIERSERLAVEAAVRKMDPLSAAIRESMGAVLRDFGIPASKLDEASRNAAQAVMGVIEDGEIGDAVTLATRLDSLLGTAETIDAAAPDIEIYDRG